MDLGCGCPKQHVNHCIKHHPIPPPQPFPPSAHCKDSQLVGLDLLSISLQLGSYEVSLLGLLSKGSWGHPEEMLAWRVCSQGQPQRI